MGNYSSFAGLDNYGIVFTDARLRNAVVNTIVLTVSVVLISLAARAGARACCSTASSPAAASPARC